MKHLKADTLKALVGAAILLAGNQPAMALSIEAVDFVSGIVSRIQNNDLVGPRHDLRRLKALGIVSLLHDGKPVSIDTLIGWLGDDNKVPLVLSKLGPGKWRFLPCAGPILVKVDLNAPPELFPTSSSGVCLV